ncbi:MAG: AI-2E family transporter, partial [Desulfofustis sp.]|nr:AI-2E family transporter [Desulfofustis sp.]
KYLAIKSVTSFFTGALIFVFLKFQGVDFPILWGMIAFLLNFIPNIGSLLAAVPPVLLALIQFGFGQALVTAGAFLAVNTVIGSIIEPRVMGQGVGLSTLVVFLSLIFWGWVLGPVGMLLSVPLTMGIKIALAEYDSTRWIAILLGSNREVAKALEARATSEE